jgi:hypothetical protein
MERKISLQCHLKLEHIKFHMHWKLKNTAMCSPIRRDIIYLFLKKAFIHSDNLFITVRTLGKAFMYDVNYNTSGPLAHSSHKMRYKPFLGSMHPKTQTIRKQRGRSSNTFFEG